MSITLNYTTISDAEDSGTWSTVGDASGLADSDYPSKEGTQCIEFDCGATSVLSGIKSPTVTGFSCETNEIGIWFLNPVVNENGDRLLQTGDDALVLRLYSGTNYADYYQHHHKNENGEYNGGWLYLRASGKPGTEDTNSGTWGSSQTASITAIATLIKTTNSNTNKNAAEYGVDWAKYYNKIIITGYKTGTTPYSLSDIYDTDIDKSVGGGVWGVVEKTGVYFSFYCGLEFGDGTNAGSFVSENEFIYLEQSSPTQDYDILIKNNFSLTLGKYDTGTDNIYAKNGTPIVVTFSPLFQLSTPEKPTPDFIVDNGGLFNCYNSQIRGFNNINLGSNGSSVIDLIKVDFYSNSTVDFYSTNLKCNNCKLHFEDTSKSNIGNIYSYNELNDIKSFQSLESFTVRTNSTFYRYIARSNTNDLVILDGITVNMIDSYFDPTTLKRTL
jgi:hypothetical protein